MWAQLLLPSYCFEAETFLACHTWFAESLYPGNLTCYEIHGVHMAAYCRDDLVDSSKTDQVYTTVDFSLFQYLEIEQRFQQCVDLILFGMIFKFLSSNSGPDLAFVKT